MDAETFTLLLPLPYRLSILLVLGIWLWGLALHLLRILPRLIGYAHTQQTHQSTYTFASLLSSPVVVSVLFYASVVTKENAATWRFLPNLTLLLVILAFVPIHVKGVPLPRAGRTRFISTLRRISIGGLAKQDEPRFGDVLLADALTSYARPLSELYIALCMFLPRKHTQQDVVDSTYGANLIIPLLAAYPFAVRFRQCLIARQPANAVKYCTAFPPIVLGALLSSPGAAAPENEASLRAWWIFTAVLNSTYSLWWDIFRDWDLPLISSKQPSRILGLAPRCYIAVVLDSILRFTWALRLSLRLDIYEFQERTIFVLEMLEVLRRGMWLLFRAETEWLRKKGESVELSLQGG